MEFPEDSLPPVHVGAHLGMPTDQELAFSESECEMIEQFDNAFQLAFLSGLTPQSELTAEQLIAEFHQTYSEAEQIRRELLELYKRLDADQATDRPFPNKPR